MTADNSGLELLYGSNNSGEDMEDAKENRFKLVEALQTVVWPHPGRKPTEKERGGCCSSAKSTCHPMFVSSLCTLPVASCARSF